MLNITRCFFSIIQVLHAYSIKKSICCWLWILSICKISKYLPVLLKETICIKHICWHIVDAQNMLITFLHPCCDYDLKIDLQKICFLIRVFVMTFYYILFNSMIFYYLLFDSMTITFKIHILICKVPKFIHCETTFETSIVQFAAFQIFLHEYLPFLSYFPPVPLLLYFLISFLPMSAQTKWK